MWEKMATCVRKIASEVLGVTKESGCDSKDTWWWNKNVQKAIKEKKECYKRLYHDRCAYNIEKYKMAKKTAKRAECGKGLSVRGSLPTFEYEGRREGHL